MIESAYWHRLYTETRLLMQAEQWLAALDSADELFEAAETNSSIAMSADIVDFCRKKRDESLAESE